MKIAGRKNLGAWQRTNKVLHKLLNQDAVPLATVIGDIETLPAAYAAMQDLRAKVGAPASSFHTSATAWAGALAQDVPACIYMGNLAFDTYDPTTYTADHQKAIRLFGADLRTAYKRFLFGLRQLKDAQNTQSRTAGNPSGIADGDISNNN